MGRLFSSASRRSNTARSGIPSRQQHRRLGEAGSPVPADAGIDGVHYSQGEGLMFSGAAAVVVGAQVAGVAGTDR